MLLLQDISLKNSLTLDEVLASYIDDENTHRMYGAYAFVSSDGVKRVFTDKVDKLNEIQLVIGIDDITNTKSVNTLNNLLASESSNVKAFMPSKRGSIFHPKFCIFSNEDQTSGTLIIGSGNLTLGGLRKNREAFSAINLDETTLKVTLQNWRDWISANSMNLLPLDDERVEAQLVYNEAKFKFKRTIEKDLPKPPDVEDVEDVDDVDVLDWYYGLDSDLLIAEIPKSGNRWKQANFDSDTYENYFGGSKETSTKVILLKHVDPLTGSLEDLEERPCVAVKSVNYRIELQAASNLDYPLHHSPIAIFIKIAERTFIYSLYMPEHPIYNELNTWVEDNWIKKGKRQDRKCRLVFAVREQLSLIKKTKLFRYLDPI